jgi:hypothetical protein
MSQLLKFTDNLVTDSDAASLLVSCTYAAPCQGRTVAITTPEGRNAPGPERKAINQKNCVRAGELHVTVRRCGSKLNWVLFSKTFWILSVNLKFESFLGHVSLTNPDLCYNSYQQIHTILLQLK